MTTAVGLVDQGFNCLLSKDALLTDGKNSTAPSRDEYGWRFPELAEPLQLRVAYYDTPGHLGPVADDASSAPTRRAAEAPPAHEPAARTGVKGWPALPGYEILGVLGRGGMAVVYKARHLRLQRLVAIKVSDPSLAGEGEPIARFHQEQVLAARLTHPNLVAAYDAGQVAGCPYLVMECVEGHDLAWLVRQRGPLPAAEACEVVRQAALGLQHLHEQGLVHRDVKPANLMLTPSGQVKVLDLGLARYLHVPAQGGRITSPGQFLGTLDYMAPEQCLDSHAVDSRADIYALGCTLYELLAGEPPFAGPAYESAFLKMRAHVEAPVPPIRGRRSEVPERLAATLERMLAKDRTGRFASPAGVVAALQPFAAGADLTGLSQAFPPAVVAA
jgi:eukaryotic-like serine/threonine-protein kinase